MKRYSHVLIILCLLTAIPTVRASDPPSDKNSRISYRRLTWDDFRVDDRTPGMSAQTHTFTSFGFKSRVTGHDGEYTATAIEVTFDGGFDRNRSWRRSIVPRDNSQQLLQHEQGHFDITELKLRQLRRWNMAALPTGHGVTSEEAHKDLKRQLEVLYHTEVDDLEKTQNRYDAETDHGVRTEIQQDWTRRLNRALELLPPITSPTITLAN